MNISLVEMMLNAGLMVQAVMLALLIFSVGSWSIIIMKIMLFKKLKRNSDEFLDRFWESKTLNEAYDSARDYTDSPEAAVFVSGFHELKKISMGREGQDRENDSLEMQLATLDNVKRAMRKAQLMELDRVSRWLPFLALLANFLGLPLPKLEAVR